MDTKASQRGFLAKLIAGTGALVITGLIIAGPAGSGAHELATSGVRTTSGGPNEVLAP